MRYVLTLALSSLMLYAHQDFSVEIESNYVKSESLNSYRIDNFLIAPDMELLSEDFSIHHLSASLHKEFLDSYLLGFSISNHQHNSTYINEAYLKYFSDYFDIKLGRSFSSFGIQNSHNHSLFIEKPLAYRIFLNDDLNDEGAFLRFKYQNYYTQIELLSGDEYPSRDSSSAYVFTLGAYEKLFDFDIELKASLFNSTPNDRYHFAKTTHSHSNKLDTTLAYNFNGDVDIYLVGTKIDFKLFQCSLEYFYKNEDGSLRDRLREVGYSSKQNGIYFELIKENLYGFDFGARYNLAWSKNRLSGASAKEFRDELNLNGETPESINLSLKYQLHKNHSITFEYDINNLYKNDDNQMVVSYKLSF